VFRPPEVFGQTRAGWFHLDQNGNIKPGKQCVQGFLNLYDSGPDDGGLVVVPNSNNLFDSWFGKGGIISKKKGDFVPLSSLPMQEHWGKGNLPIKICLQPGDFVMWDSRTSHCNHPAKVTPENYPKRLRRLVAYVCMTPASRAKDLKDLQAKRIHAFETGATLNHWPHEYNPHPTDHSPADRRYTPVQLNDYQKQLIVGKKV